MTRKIIIYIISVFVMVLGVNQVAETILPLFDSTQPKNLFVIIVSLISGTFTFFMVWRLIRLNELGRKLVLWLVFVPLTGVALIVFILILPPNSHFAIHIRLLGKLLFDSENNYFLSIIFMFAVLVINLMALFFLGQKETKKIFLPEKADNSAPKANLEQVLKL